MRALALGLSTLFALGLAGCGGKEPAAQTSATTEAMTVARDAPPVAPAENPIEPSVAAIEAEEPVEASGEQPAGEEGLIAVEAPLDGARDAKEATEAAARKIFDATRSAALKLKEAGREAVQSVRRDGADKPAEEPATVAN